MTPDDKPAEPLTEDQAKLDQQMAAVEVLPVLRRLWYASEVLAILKEKHRRAAAPVELGPDGKPVDDAPLPF